MTSKTTLSLVAALGLGACAEGPAPEGSNFASSTAVQACVLGGLGGAALGLLAQGDGLGALVGGGVGAAAGCTVGATLDARRQQFADDSAFLDQQIEIASSANRDLLELEAGLDQRISRNRERLVALERRAEHAARERAQVAADVERAKAEHARAAEQLRLARLELEVQQRTLDTYAAKAAGERDEARIEALSTEVAQMTSLIGALDARLGEFYALNQSLADHA